MMNEYVVVLLVFLLFAAGWMLIASITTTPKQTTEWEKELYGYLFAERRLKAGISVDELQPHPRETGAYRRGAERAIANWKKSGWV